MKSLTSVIAGLVVLVASGLPLLLWVQNRNPEPEFTLTPPLAEVRVPVSVAEARLSFSPLVKTSAPAVVSIVAKVVTEDRPSLIDDPFFDRFFGFGPSRKRINTSLGSGVIVHPSGLVVTNYHVVRGAREIKVVLEDGREIEARTLSESENDDLALLQIEGESSEFPYIPLANSDGLEVGDLVLAIGNPFGVGQTTTMGIVSALARTGVRSSGRGYYIQTDAAINPGNSGGALITQKGELAGINAAIYTRSGGSLGIGFAIPSNMVRVFVNAHLEGKPFERPWLGAVGQDLTSELAEAMNYPRPKGVLVSDIYPGGPADKAGLKTGDIVVKLGSEPVGDTQSLDYLLTTNSFNRSLFISIARATSRGRFEDMVLIVTLGSLPESPAPDRRLLEGSHPLAGAEVANLSPAFARELDLADNWEGVVVTRVASRSPAAYFGFEPGDILLSIEDQRITSSDMLEDFVADGGSNWRMSMKRDEEVHRLRLRF